MICTFDDDLGHYTENNAWSGIGDSSRKYIRNRITVWVVCGIRMIYYQKHKVFRETAHTQQIQATSHAPHTWDTPHTMHWDDFFFPADAAQGHRWEVLLILLKGTSKVTNSMWHPLEPVEPVLWALKHQPACLCCDRTGTMEHFLLS